MQPGEGKIGLGLRAPGTQHSRRPSHLGGVVKQRGLADPRLAQHHQTAALAVAGVTDQPLDLSAFVLTADQGGTWLIHIQATTQQTDISDTQPGPRPVRAGAATIGKRSGPWPRPGGPVYPAT